jgi:hypothetical protein
VRCAPAPARLVVRDLPRTCGTHPPDFFWPGFVYCRKLDPPSNYFRIRLVCTLLEACGQYYGKGPARRKLDRFLPHFQRYVLAKPPLPLDVAFDVQVLPAAGGSSENIVRINQPAGCDA